MGTRQTHDECGHLFVSKNKLLHITAMIPSLFSLPPSSVQVLDAEEEVHRARSLHDVP